MLQLKNIVKNYEVGDIIVHALKGVNLSFRESEFVAILGPSGCGKTTMLNIIGGLDKYTDGDLVIDRISTKDYEDSDWDQYRNNTIGFVFQTYNLIPHQSVVANVELSLTLSGISKTERRARAIEALEKVGLNDQIYKKPNQLSGGQMQRVAIARAIVNNPHIILADEPTGALDTETSIQVMEILKEISKDHLIIMVTHNPELAKEYATRTIKLLDGNVIHDDNPVTDEEIEKLNNIKIEDETKKVSKKFKQKKVGMSFFTALSLSLNNLLTKKARTILTSFAGSIGIIGIALILSLSAGFDAYISDIEEDTLSTYPLTITSTATDLSSFSEANENSKNPTNREDGYIYSNDILTTIIGGVAQSMSQNNMRDFKTYIDENEEKLSSYVTDVQYTYDLNLNIYNGDYATATKPTLLNPYSFTENINPMMKPYLTQLDTMMSTMNVWQEMIGNQEFLESQYELVDGKWPSEYNEVVLVVDKNKGINDYFLFAIGMKDAKEIEDIIMNSFGSNKVEIPETKYNYNDIIGRKYRMVLDTDFYQKEGSVYVDKKSDENKLKDVLVQKGIDLEIVGILSPQEGVSTTAISGAIAYTSKLSDYAIAMINSSEVVNAQKLDETVNILTGNAIDSNPEKAAKELETIYQTIGVVDKANPTSINFYPSSFEGKDKIVEFIAEYNSTREKDEDQIKYSDFIGEMMSSITVIINAISYVLIAFVSISLVVSSIMIGIITYISVLERIKEIGVLRSIGASKKDISRVFNAETLIVGFAAGVFGILITLILNIPINLIIDALAGIGSVAKLPLVGGIVLVVISTLLTMIAGVIPAKIAAKKDPVIALRSE